MRKRPDGDRQRLIAAVEGGATLAQAAAAVGIPVGTVHSWARRGRERPEGPLGPFAAAVAERGRGLARLTVPPSADPRSRPSREELLDLLGEAARRGNVRAAEILLRHTPPTIDTGDEEWLDRLLAPAS
jgi:hypothetical protein